MDRATVEYIANALQRMEAGLQQAADTSRQAAMWFEDRRGDCLHTVLGFRVVGGPPPHVDVDNSGLPLSCIIAVCTVV